MAYWFPFFLEEGLEITVSFTELVVYKKIYEFNWCEGKGLIQDHEGLSFCSVAGRAQRISKGLGYFVYISKEVGWGSELHSINIFPVVMAIAILL